MILKWSDCLVADFLVACVTRVISQIVVYFSTIALACGARCSGGMSNAHMALAIFQNQLKNLVACDGVTASGVGRIGQYPARPAD